MATTNSDNRQDHNAANLGDLAKHAALAALTQLFVSRNPTFNWLDTHAYKLETTPTEPLRKDWSEQLQALATSHPGYQAYQQLEEAFLARSRYLCSSGVVLELAGKSARLFLAEKHPATRAELRRQLEARGHSPQLLLEDVRDFGRLPLSNSGEQAKRPINRNFSAPLLALVDPLPPKKEDWPQIWTDDAVGGWPSARQAIASLHAAGTDGALLLYQWRQHDEAVTWPEAPPSLGAKPRASLRLQQRSPKSCYHHLALYTSDGLWPAANTLANTLGWQV
ncbi:MAG: hypothetical protein RBU37_19045 [Myxococcota bacterium]|jgi:hypothetical protein|nr:hypothetical protein [Myxococcota bacterium]